MPRQARSDQGTSRIWTRGSSTRCGLRQGAWCCLCWLVQHGLWPSLYMCAPWGLTLCLWWHWSCWGVLLSMSVPEVATRWDLDSSRCEGVKGMFVKLKTTPLFSSSSHTTNCWALKEEIIYACFVCLFCSFACLAAFTRCCWIWILILLCGWMHMFA